MLKLKKESKNDNFRYNWKCAIFENIFETNLRIFVYIPNSYYAVYTKCNEIMNGVEVYA